MPKRQRIEVPQPPLAIERAGEVRGGVDERAVEIEQDGGDHAGRRVWRM
jgi:hypothetical protein